MTPHRPRPWAVPALFSLSVLVAGVAGAQTRLTGAEMDRVHAGAFSFSGAMSSTTPEGATASVIVSGGDGGGLTGIDWSGWWGGFDIASLNASLAASDRGEARVAQGVTPGGLTAGASATGEGASAVAGVQIGAGSASSVAVAGPAPSIGAELDRAIVPSAPVAIAAPVTVAVTPAYDWAAILQSLNLSFGFGF